MPLNKFRYKVFEKAYRTKANSKNPLDRLKALDASEIPPCESELVCHVRRAAFVAKIWSNANKQEINQRPSEADGWELVDNSYMIVWHESDQLPDTLVPDENIEDESSGTDEECQAEFRQMTRTLGMTTVMRLQKTLIPSELVYQYLMFRLLLSDNNSRLFFQAHY